MTKKKNQQLMKKKSANKMAEFYNVCKKTILSYAKEIGYVNKYRNELTDSQIQYVLDNYNNKTSTEIADELNISKSYVKQITKQRHFDTVLSHTCPIKTEPRHMFLPFIDQSKVDKTTELFLQRVADWITFDNWYFGHFHGHWDNGKYHMLI